MVKSKQLSQAEQNRKELEELFDVSTGKLKDESKKINAPSLIIAPIKKATMKAASSAIVAAKPTMAAQYEPPSFYVEPKDEVPKPIVHTGFVYTVKSEAIPISGIKTYRNSSGGIRYIAVAIYKERTFHYICNYKKTIIFSDSIFEDMGAKGLKLMIDVLKSKGYTD